MAFNLKGGMEMKKRILSGFLSVILCVTLLGNITYAQNGAEETVEETESDSGENDIETGSAQQLSVDAAADGQQQNEEEQSAENQWMLTGMDFDKNSPQEVSETIEISAQIKNENDAIFYKYVWMRDNWAEWGVIQDFSHNKVVNWKPEKSGEYSLYVNVKSENRAAETFTRSYTIIKNQWNYEGMLPEMTEQKLGETIDLSPNITGNSAGLRYKYVWMKDDWSQWGILRDFSTEKNFEFTPEDLGEYTIIIDIKDQDGDVVTRNKTYKVKTTIWQYIGITTDLPSPQQKYTEPIKISAETAGETEDLKYKYVWMKDNWSDWGVISDLSLNSSTEWYPEEEGTYTIYVDVKDIDGEIITKAIPYEITKLQWQFDEIKVSPDEVQRKGSDVEIEAITSGNNEKLQYKFVWMKDDWADWGVLQDFSEKSKITWKAPDVTGEYKIYVNVMDRDHDTKTLDLDYFVATQIWQPGEININNDISEQVYTRIPISVSAEGETQNLEYKFVWKGGPDNGDWMRRPGHQP